MSFFNDHLLPRALKEVGRFRIPRDSKVFAFERKFTTWGDGEETKTLSSFFKVFFLKLTTRSLFC
jgi:hypothetical protein